MKAYKIDPQEQTVSAVLVRDPAKHLDSIYEHLNCTMFDVIRVGDCMIFVDEEGLLKNPANQHYWRLNIPGFQSHLAGPGLAFGLDEQDECISPFWAISQMAGIVSWVERPTDAELEKLTTPCFVPLG